MRCLTWERYSVVPLLGATCVHYVMRVLQDARSFQAPIKLAIDVPPDRETHMRLGWDIGSSIRRRQCEDRPTPPMPLACATSRSRT